MAKRTLKQISDQIVPDAHISVRAGRQYLRRLLEELRQELIQQGRVELRGFGSFSVSTRKARKGKHPKTGQPIEIAQTRFVRFRAAGKLRHGLNRKV